MSNNSSSNPISNFAFVPITKQQQNMFNFKDLHNNFESFVADLSKAIYSLEETSEQIIKDIIIKQTESHYFKPQEEKEKTKRAPQAKSSYMFFVETKRNTFVSENPEASATEIAKICGLRWNALTAEEKQPYIDMHLKMKEEMANGTYVAPVKEPKAKKPKAPKGEQ